MRPNHQEFTDGLRLAGIAVVSAIVTATVVIGVGRTIEPQRAAVAATPEMIQAVSR